MYYTGAIKVYIHQRLRKSEKKYIKIESVKRTSGKRSCDQGNGGYEIDYVKLSFCTRTKNDGK